MTMPVVKPDWKCAICSKTVRRKGNHPPRGWKRKGDEYFDPECWGSKYILRAITMRVVQPIDATWEELRAALKTMWVETTRAGNYIMTACFAGDVRREPGQVKMPAMPERYLYPELRLQFPSLPPQTISSLERSVKAKYRKVRYKVVWTCAASLPTMRYPTPFPVHNQSWEAQTEANSPVVSVRIGGIKLRLRLKGGPQFRRQRAAFDAIHRGEAEAGELAIYQRGKPPKIMVKMVAWLPRKERAKDLSGTLSVRTDKDSLLVALNTKDEALWRYNADHARRWIREHRQLLQRFNEDTKFEHRPVPPFRVRREQAVKKFHDRMDSICHQVAASLEGYAQRNNYAVVRYDDSLKDYCPDFPWARLRSLTSEKLDAFGIRFEAASGDSAKESQDLSQNE